MDKEVKKDLINQVDLALNDKRQELLKHIANTIDSRDSDTKSSAGDKFETSREMAQIELNNLEAQLAKVSKQINELQQISINPTERITIGSLVQTNKAIYLIAIPFGKIQNQNATYYVISLASPIGQLLNQKKKGDSIQFNGNNELIINYL